ncbi:MAG: hypothetical protein ACP5OG_03675 [Candidatus Nanoarchaeia archaeon]
MAEDIINGITNFLRESKYLILVIIIIIVIIAIMKMINFFNQETRNTDSMLNIVRDMKK